MYPVRRLILNIKYLNGTREKYEVDALFDETKQTQQIEELMNSPVIAIQTRQNLVVIPTSSIQRIEISPTPMKFPISVLRNGRRLPICLERKRTASGDVVLDLGDSP